MRELCFCETSANALAAQQVASIQTVRREAARSNSVHDMAPTRVRAKKRYSSISRLVLAEEHARSAYEADRVN